MSGTIPDDIVRPPCYQGVQAVGHVVTSYLPLSATFIYTALRHQQRVRPIVLARRTENLADFPLDDVVGVLPRRIYPRLARKVPRLAALDYTRRLATCARRHGCSVLHAHFGWTACDVLDSRDRLDVPLITSFYGHDLASSYAESYPYERLFETGDFFLCEGAVMKNRLVSLGCPESKVRITKIGLSLADFTFAPPRRSRPFVILQTARFVEKKGVDLSIRAFALARPRLGQSELWLVGDGELRPNLEALAVELGVRSSVRFLGLRRHAEVRALAREAHICIQPSRTARDGDTEGGAPTVLLEMQAIGVPVVSTRHADIPSVVAEPDELAEEDDVDGLAEALVRLANLSDDEWRRRSQHGRVLVEAEHDAVVLARHTEDLYAEAAALSCAAQPRPLSELQSSLSSTSSGRR